MEPPEGGMPDSSDMTPGLSKTGSSTMDNNKRYLRMKNTLPKRDASPIIVHVHLSLERLVLKRYFWGVRFKREIILINVKIVNYAVNGGERG